MLCDELLGGMERVNASSMQGFLTIYAFLCDFFGVKYNAELSWVSVEMVRGGCVSGECGGCRSVMSGDDECGGGVWR